MTISSRPTLRRGFTLVEMLVFIAAGAAVLVLSVTMIHLLMRLDRASRDHLAVTADLGRLARAFRADVRAATEAQGNDENTHITLFHPNGRTVAYRVDDQELRRIQAEDGEPPRQEVFRLPRNTSARFEVINSDGRTFIRLDLDRTVIDALLARDHRFLQAQNREGASP